jgi:hypothetical protein
VSDIECAFQVAPTNYVRPIAVVVSRQCIINVAHVLYTTSTLEHVAVVVYIGSVSQAHVKSFALRASLSPNSPDLNGGLTIVKILYSTGTLCTWDC